MLTMHCVQLYTSLQGSIIAETVLCLESHSRHMRCRTSTDFFLSPRITQHGNRPFGLTRPCRPDVMTELESLWTVESRWTVENSMSKGLLRCDLEPQAGVECFASQMDNQIRRIFVALYRSGWYGQVSISSFIEQVHTQELLPRHYSAMRENTQYHYYYKNRFLANLAQKYY